MGMMDLALGALAVILVGGYAKKSGAGLGLSEISGGIVDLISAPLVGSATGITAFSESIGGLGRGLGDFWEAMPDIRILPPIAGTSNIVTGNGVNGVNGVNGNGFIKKIANDIGNGTDAGGGNNNAGGEENGSPPPIIPPPIIPPPIDHEEQWSTPAMIRFPLPQIRRENGYWVT